MCNHHNVSVFYASLFERRESLSSCHHSCDYTYSRMGNGTPKSGSVIGSQLRDYNAKEKTRKMVSLTSIL
jgi:hypothetical protein